MACPEARRIEFPGVACDECDARPIVGARWKCDVCQDYDLCTACYLSCEHSLEHSFVRFDSPQRKGIKVTSKLESCPRSDEDTFARSNGVTFKFISCDACDQREIVGLRWKCAVCYDYDLCTACFRKGKHNHDHAFLRIDVPNGEAVTVPPRRGSRTEANRFFGIYCDSCDKRPISGTRWKCALCVDYDLCNICYMRGKHHLEHTFLRLDVPGGTAEVVAPRIHPGRMPVGNIQDNDVTFRGINCDGCDKRGIVGARWKCEECYDYDLCTACYLANTHNLDHCFTRFDMPGKEGIKVSPRQRTIERDDGANVQEAANLYDINCDSCEEHSISGTRWKCALCVNYDLCTTCYERGEHNLDHVFLRVDEHGSTAEVVAPRIHSGRVPVETIQDYGVSFTAINCDGCNKRGIEGARWKCQQCSDYDLCTSCYVANTHSLDHCFTRFDVPGDEGLMVAPRHGTLKMDSRGGAQNAIVFHGISCDSCDEHDIIAGPRWKCDSCSNCDLCTACYMAGAHDLDHGFLRFDAPEKRGDKIVPRVKSALFVEVPDDSEMAKGDQRAVKFNGINCDGCEQRGIVGTRWKCALCINYDLCTACYRGDKHDLCHSFLRFEMPGAGGVHVLPREATRNVHTEAPSSEDQEVWENRQNEKSALKPTETPDGDPDAREELVTKLRELEDVVQCAICMEGRRNVAFLCGHSACTDCAENLSVCHMCRETITKKIMLY